MAVEPIWAASIDSADFCVTEGAFHFDVQITGNGDEVILRVGADAAVFGGDNERIAVNFDSTSGEITRQEPIVQTFGTADFDRWQDGLIADAQIIAEGGFSWRFTGSVAHGNDPFLPGDTLWGVVLRTLTQPDIQLLELPISACEPEMVVLDVPRTFNRPTIDGELDFGEWGDAVMHDTESGFIALMHDLDRLYVLIDVLTDGVDDSFANGGGDQFWLYFDVDEDGVITPDVDLRFRLESGFGNLRYQTFCEDCLFGFNPLEPSTFSSRGEGFGCFFEDLSLSLLPPPSGGFSCNNHRVWEIALDLGEIEMRDQTGRLGYLIASGTPLFNETFPSNLNDLGSYADLTLLGSTRALGNSGPGAMNPQFEVSQAIQTRNNDLDLAAGKPTFFRIWDSGNDALVKVFVHGRRDGTEIPGSPLLFVTRLFDTVFSNPDPRDTTRGNLTMQLPSEWAIGGTVDFMVDIMGLDGSDVATLQDDILFAPTRNPVFWTVPLRYVNPDSTFTDVPMIFLTRSEQRMRSVAPLDVINIVRRPIFAIETPGSANDALSAMKTYDQQTILAWTSSFILSGGSPYFVLPSQTIGFGPQNPKATGGISDPVWTDPPGLGRVSWTTFADLNFFTMNEGGNRPVHEVNHNLDTDEDGSWGRHVPACGLSGPTDPAWPYANEDIQEVGIRLTIGGSIDSIPDTTNDIMSKGCPVGSGFPRQWFSPYRWDAWLNLYRTDILAATASSTTENEGRRVQKHSGRRDSGIQVDAVESGIDNRFYVMGRIFPDGDGEIGLVWRQPGPLMTDSEIGEYAVQVHSCDEHVLGQAHFTASFVGVEGQARDYVTFDFTLPAPEESCAIELRREGEVLDRRDISDNPPVVTLLTPNGGENWAGVETASWNASDDDGDDLSFSLLYSPDGGMNWLPVALGISGNSYEINTSVLPGSNDARLRVLTSDGANTTHDDSDASFTVAMKPPTVTILAPADNGVFDANEPLGLEGIARNTFGEALPGDDLIWTIGGVPVGMGETLSINLDEGDYTIVLSAEDAEGMVGSAAVNITMANLSAVEDPMDVDLPAVDLAEARAYVADERLVCEMTVRSREYGLQSRSRFACHIDFDDEEEEMVSQCDADGDGELISGYRLGSNGSCSTSDMALSYRHDRRGGACTGGPEVMCSTIEFNADGMSDGQCDGMVDGEPATTCQVVITGLLSTVAAERDAQCADAGDVCLGGVNELTGTYRAYNFFEAHYRSHKDWVPDTDDGEAPNALGEAVLISLMQ